jgi:OmpA-OmpF porin, OOP family
MPDSYLASLSRLLPSTTVQSIGSRLGVSEQTILGGVQSSIAAVVSGLLQRLNDTGLMNQVTQLASATPENGGDVSAFTRRSD